jgi:hypothetical protein
MSFEVKAPNIDYAYDVIGEQIQDAVACQTECKELWDALVGSTVLDVEECCEEEEK